MEKTEAQNRVYSMLSAGNVCARVGRRWGKTKLCELIARDFADVGKKVAYVAYNLFSVRDAIRGYDFRAKEYIYLASDGLPRGSDFDLLLLDEPALFPACFWRDLANYESRSKILAIGTQVITAPSAEIFARLPFRSGWGFYSGGTDEAYPFRGLAQSIEEARQNNPDMTFKTEFMGH